MSLDFPRPMRVFFDVSRAQAWKSIAKLVKIYQMAIIFA